MVSHRLPLLLRDLLLYGTGTLLLRATTLVTLPVFTRVFTPQEYGAWHFITAMLGLLGGVISLGTEGAFLRFHFSTEDEGERRGLATLFVAFVALWSLAASLALLPLSEWVAAWGLGGRRMAAAVALGILSLPPELTNRACGQVLRGHFAAARLVRLEAVGGLVRLAAMLGAVLTLDLGVTGLLGAQALAALAMLGPYALAVRPVVGRPRRAVAELRRLLGFGLPLAPTTLFFWVILASDRVVVAKLAGLDELGTYAVATALSGALYLLHGITAQAWVPRAIELWEEDRNAALRWFDRMLEGFLVLFGIAAVLLTAAAEPMVDLLAPPAFGRAADLVPVLALGMVALATTQVTSLGITISNRTFLFPLVSGAAAALNLGLNLILVPRWGILAAAYSTLASYALLTLAYAAISRRVSPLRWRPGRAILLSGLALGYCVALPILEAADPLWTTALRLAAAATLPALMVISGLVPSGDLATLVRVVRGAVPRRSPGAGPTPPPGSPR